MAIPNFHKLEDISEIQAVIQEIKSLLMNITTKKTPLEYFTEDNFDSHFRYNPINKSKLPTPYKIND